MKTSRYVAPVLACLLLLPLLLRDCAFAAPAQNNPAGDKVWRVIYVEGGPFSDYQRIFQGLALGLEERGLIENGHVPLPKDSEEARGIWEWLHQRAGGNHLVFLADGFYSAGWDSRQRETVRQEVLRRIREKKDVDMVLAFGTWAGQDLAAQDLPVPVIVSSVTNAVDAGIIPSVEDSGRDNLVAPIEPDRFKRQVLLFHDIFAFKKLGIAYEDTPAGRGSIALNEIEDAARELGITLLRCTDTFDIQDTDLASERLLACHKKLVDQGAEAVYLTYNVGLQAGAMRRVLQPLADEVRRRGADIVVVLSHLPGTVAADGSCAGELFDAADAMDAVDVMIGGHNTGSIACVRGETVFAKAGFSAGQLAHIRLRLDENRQIVERGVRIYDMMDGAEALPPPDAAIQRAVDAVMAPYRPKLNEPLAHLSRPLRVEKDGECALGNFYTDGLREAAKAPVGLFNTTSIFGFMPAGTVTAEMVTHVMCFDEEIYAGDMTGGQLRRLFERTYAREHWRNNWSLQFSGIRVVVDTRRPEGERVVSLCREDGTPIAPETRIRVATTDYIAMGGNDYRDITSLIAWENTHIRTHALFVEFLRQRGAIPETTDGRMRNLDPAWPDGGDE